MVDSEVLETLWGALEGGTEGRVRLEALDELESWVSPHDEAAHRRLAALAAGEPAPLSTALRHCLMRLQREARAAAPGHAAQAAGEFPAAAGREARLTFVNQAVEGLRVGVADALAGHLPTEPDPEVSAAVVRGLGVLGGPSHLPALLGAGRSPHDQVRLALVEGLAFQRGLERTRGLVERLGDPARAVRGRALEVLLEVPFRQVFAALERIPPAPRNRRRKGAVAYLAQHLDAPESRRLLLAFLDDEDPQVASEALIALAGIRDEVARRRMEDLERHPDERYRAVYRLALAAYQQGAEGATRPG